MRTKTENVMRYMPTGETYTVDLYEFHELTEDTQARIIDEYDEERRNDPYFSQWFVDFQEHEIWECVRDLEKSINGARVSWRYNPWYSCDFDCEFSYDDCHDPSMLAKVTDSGYYASMDLCDVWNDHVRKLNAIATRYEYLDYLCWDVYSDWSGFQPVRENEQFYNRCDALRELAITQWYAELERACDDVRNTIETLLRSEWDYYTSEEYTRLECEDEYAQGGKTYSCEYPYYKNGGYTGRVYYSDSRKWYTADGEFYEQFAINHACVSIVKAS